MINKIKAKIEERKRYGFMSAKDCADLELCLKWAEEEKTKTDKEYLELQDKHIQDLKELEKELK